MAATEELEAVQASMEELAVEDEELSLDLGKKKKKKAKKVEVRWGSLGGWDGSNSSAAAAARCAARRAAARCFSVWLLLRARTAPPCAAPTTAAARRSIRHPSTSTSHCHSGRASPTRPYEGRKSLSGLL